MQFVVDTRFLSDSEAILRYAPSIFSEEFDVEIAGEIAQREGFRMVPLPRYRGVEIFAMDETTRMKTGTYKSLEACITAVICRKAGLRQVAFSSGANTGQALTDYCSRAGIDTYFFCPTTTLYKINGALFQRPGAHLIAVEGPDARVKEAARLFSELRGMPLVPKMEWRVLAARLRGYFLAESMRQLGRSFSWFSQSVCAGYGPIGMYEALRELAESGEIEREWIPKFLAVQQAGLAPMVAAWKSGASTLPAGGTKGWSENPIEPALYTTNPEHTYPMIHEIVSTTAGDMVAVRFAEYDSYEALFARLLRDGGFTLTMVNVNGELQYMERAGLLAGVALLKGIQEGRFAEGESLLCSVTGGTGLKPERIAKPEAVLKINASLPEELAKIK